ncbi:MAG: 4-vinyl reductase, partial [Thermosynechococcaceae cyanobacterium]
MVLTASENSSSLLLGYSQKVDHLLKKKYPKRHNHYRFCDFFSFDSSTGSVVDWNESRNIFAGEDFIVALIEGLEEEVGSASSVVMYSMGRHWGTRD